MHACARVYMCAGFKGRVMSCDSIVQEMTITWCVRRAELVFKCVKGLLINVKHARIDVVLMENIFEMIPNSEFL